MGWASLVRTSSSHAYAYHSDDVYFVFLDLSTSRLAPERVGDVFIRRCERQAGNDEENKH